jgi:hypothetical protein
MEIKVMAGLSGSEANEKEGWEKERWMMKKTLEQSARKCVRKRKTKVRDRRD